MVNNCIYFRFSIAILGSCRAAVAGVIMKSVSIGSCNLVEASSSRVEGTSWSSVCESVGIISSSTSSKGKTLGTGIAVEGDGVIGTCYLRFCDDGHSLGYPDVGGSLGFPVAGLCLGGTKGGALLLQSLLGMT